MSDWGTIVTAVGGIVGIALTAWFGRSRDAAQVEQITAAAHNQIYESYRELLVEQRTIAAAAAEEAREARHRASRAEQRAAEAEVSAEAASARVDAAVRLLAELRPLIEAHVPGAERWLARVDQVVAASV